MTLNEYRKKLKKYHICRDCGKTDAFTLGGRTYCADCAERIRLAKAKARQDPKKLEKMRQQYRECLKRYEENHKCKTCGKFLGNEYKYKLCLECRLKYKRRQRERRLAINGDTNIRGENGICYQCNKNPCIEGKKLCQSCYDKKLPIALKNLGIDSKERI